MSQNRNPKAAMYIYTLAPIDCWEGGWFRIDEFAKKHPELGITAIRLAMEAGAVAAGCPDYGWEGDIRGDDIYVACCDRLTLTDYQELQFRPTIIVAWKQDNNGTCFVASRFPINGLDHLDGMERRIFPPLAKSPPQHCGVRASLSAIGNR